jgi:predicted TIM-barrel fold metal-dependent hydrolase
VPNDLDLAALIPSYAPSAALQRKLLVENPARLYGFP